MARPLRRGERKLMADINVTSLVDVMVVLLIMFMITAPMSQSGMQVACPRRKRDRSRLPRRSWSRWTTRVACTSIAPRSAPRSAGSGPRADPYEPRD